MLYNGSSFKLENEEFQALDESIGSNYGLIASIKYVSFINTKISKLKSYNDCKKKIDMYNKYKQQWKFVEDDYHRRGMKTSFNDVYKKISDKAKQFDPNKSIENDNYSNLEKVDEKELFKLYVKEAKNIVKKLNHDKDYLNKCVDEIIKFFGLSEDDEDIVQARKDIKSGKGLLVCDDSSMPDYLVISEWQDLSCASYPHYLVAEEVKKVLIDKKISPPNVSFGDGDEGCIYFF